MIGKCFQTLNKKSPPAWTQEAYRPRRIKYYSRWGTPPGQVWWGKYLRWGTPLSGYPLARSYGGYPRWGTPSWSTPWPGPMGGNQGGVPPHQGTPPARSDGEAPKVGYPPLGYPPVRVPPWPGLTRGVPKVGYPLQSGYHPLSGYPPSWTSQGYPPPPPPAWTWLGYPPPPPRCGQTESSPDRHVSKHNLPSYYVRGR